MYKRFTKGDRSAFRGTEYVCLTKSGLVSFGPDIVPAGSTHVEVWVDKEVGKIKFCFSTNKWARVSGKYALTRANSKGSVNSYRSILSGFIERYNLPKKRFFFSVVKPVDGCVEIMVPELLEGTK